MNITTGSYTNHANALIRAEVSRKVKVEAIYRHNNDFLVLIPIGKYVKSNLI